MSWFAPLTILTACLGLIGCSGGGGSRDSGSTSISDTAPIIVSLTASSSVVNNGESVTLTWSSSNADSCEASGGWSGSKSLAGLQDVGPLDQDTNFRLSCSSAGGGAVQQVNIQVDDGEGVSVTLDASPRQIVAGGTTTLSWSSNNAMQCTASGGWSGDQNVDGSYVAGPIDADTSFQLTCEGQSGSAVAIASVTLIDKTLRWQAPTQNVDGSSLTDLAGFRIHWGLASRNYTGSYTINSASVTQWEATVAPGEYYFALTAFDEDANESAYSNEVLKAIP